jgi:hypothetical protein
MKSSFKPSVRSVGRGLLAVGFLLLAAGSSARASEWQRSVPVPPLVDRTDETPRAKFPVKVTVRAYQFGRLAEPKIQSAAPVF